MTETRKNNTGRTPADDTADRQRKRKKAGTIGLILLAVALSLLSTWSNNEHERRMRLYYMEQAKRRKATEQLYESLEKKRQIFIRQAEAAREEARRNGNTGGRISPSSERIRAEELIDKYNRGEELSPAEKDFVHDELWQDYYEDPDDEGHYPSEIFDDREDYDEEHVRDNPGTAGED